MILLIDNYDSFTYNVKHYLLDLNQKVIVFRNDKISINKILKLKPKSIVISPGPCTPNEAGISLNIVAELSKQFPILGICLGHQTIGQAFGGKIVKSRPAEIGMMDINFTQEKNKDNLFSKFPDQIKSLQWHSYEVQEIENNNDVTLLASSPITKYQIFKYQDHAYGIQFHIEIKDTTVKEWGCVPEYKKALEDQLGNGALEKFDQSAKDNMTDMNNYSKILYDNFKKLL